jgi:hypothetical protein
VGCQEASVSSRLSRPSKIFWRPIWPLAGRVVALSLQGRPELDGGDEEAARFADRLEVAVEFDGSRAVAVAEHAAVHFAAEFPHLSALLVSW